MPAVKCPFDGCDYVTDDLEATIVVALIKAHTTAHTVGKVVTTKTPAEPKTSNDPVTPPTPTDNVHRSVGDLNIPLQICHKYNSNGCDRGNACPFLHLCKSYNESRCESGKECSKNHNILQPQVKAIMEKHGIDVKRKTKEILRDLQAAVKEFKGQSKDDSKTKQKDRAAAPKKGSIQICNKYNGDCCEKGDTCQFLHLCKSYIESRCESGKECNKSHNILEPQVKAIMTKHGIDVNRKFKEILRDLQTAVKESKGQNNDDSKTKPKAKVSSEKTPKKSFVGICYKYNGGGCEIANSCPFLHLCKNYIESRCESGKECKKSHNILEPQVKVIMEKHGIDVKRKPKEIFPDLLASVNEGKRQRERDNSKAQVCVNKPSKPTICYKYNNSGCENSESCPRIHMCRDYIYRKCEAGKGCAKSHNILQLAVKSKLEQHGMNTKQKPGDLLAELRAALRSETDAVKTDDRKQVNDADGNKKSAPKICFNYNGRGCEKAGTCSYIHMCKSYIYGKCEAGRGCNKSHDILEQAVKANLEKHGINTKRKPKDILADFQAAINGENRKGNITPGCGAKVATHSRKPAKVSRKKVCIFNLRGICKWNFCPNVHWDLPYQWRWKPLSAKEWTPLYQHENVETERAFCNPANEVYRLVTEQGVNINIDFKTMIGTDFEGQVFVVNRLSTPSSVELERQLWATKWMWYWKNEYGEWMNYSDTVGEIEKGDIEQAFINNPDGQFPLREIGSIIDFSKMMQVNDNPAPEVEISRRPVFVSEKEAEERKTRQTQRKRGGQIPNQPKLERVSSTTELSAPPNWNMLPEEDLSDHRQLVPLKENDTEYKEIKGLFLESLGRPRTVRIKSIERIENGDLWEDFVGKRIKMLKKKTEKEVGERRLFHGTRNQYIDPIWSQGFDFRLSGQTSGTAYGKGSYFATTSNYSNSFAEQTSDRAMFVVKVLPGAYVRGCSEYKRPPHKDKGNPCSELYDSCVDNETNPQIFIIFDNNQIYPEYLIKYEY